MISSLTYHSLVILAPWTHTFTTMNSPFDQEKTLRVVHLHRQVGVDQRQLRFRLQLTNLGGAIYRPTGRSKNQWNMGCSYGFFEEEINQKNGIGLANYGKTNWKRLDWRGWLLYEVTWFVSIWYPFSQLKMEFDQQQIGGFNQHTMEFSRRKMLTLSTKSGKHVINKDMVII